MLKVPLVNPTGTRKIELFNPNTMNWFNRLFNQPGGTPPAPERLLRPEFKQPANLPVSASNPHESLSSDASFSNFTPRAQQVLANARKEADRFNHNFVATEHLLLGLIRLGQGVAVNVLRKMGVELDAVRDEVEKQVGTGPDQKIIGNIPYTPRVRKVLALAAKEAKALNHTYVGTEHILLGLLREGDGVAARVLRNLDVDLSQTRLEVLKELDPNFAPEGTKTPAESGPVNNPTTKVRKTPPPVDVTKRYDVYCVELNRQAVVYRNVLFKGVQSLFPDEMHRERADFFALEQDDGQIVSVAAYSVVKFCEPGITPRSENFP